MSPVPFPADMNASSARDWTVDQPRTSRDIPIQHRTTEQYLESMCNLLEELLATQRHLLARLGSSSDSRSSVEVKTSTRGVDIASKSYDGSDVCGQVDSAVQAYFEAMRQVQERVNEGTGK